MESIGPCGEEGCDLVTSHLGFVVKIANEYRNLGLPLEDLVNEGNVGLVEAAQRFSPDRGASFMSYAVWWIRKSMLRAITRDANIVHVPDYQVKKARHVWNAGKVLTRTLGREAGREEISRALDVTVAQVDQLLQLRPRKVSLDDKVGRDGDTTLLDQLADDRSVNPEEEIIRRRDRARLLQALRSLDRRQLSILVGRYGLDGGPARTLREIARSLGMSRERVRQVETEARKRLRKLLATRAAAGGRPLGPRPLAQSCS
jgi:RNA polymerase primary sigma factor